MKTSFLFTKQGFLYSKNPEGYLNHKNRILVIICEWVKRLQWVSCCSSNILLTPVPLGHSPTLDFTTQWASLSCLYQSLQGSTKKSATNPHVPSVYKCHARGQLVRMQAESPEELTESPSSQSLIRRACVDTKRGSSLSPYHQVCCAFFKCI